MEQPAKNQPKELLAAEWVDIIKREGRSCLSAKFNPGWTINGKPANPSGSSDFVYSAFSGFETNGKYYFDQLAWYDSVLNLESDHSANYLIVSQTFNGIDKLGEVLKLKPTDKFVTFHYYSYAHKDNVKDSRGHHLPVVWMFYLSESRLVDFIHSFADNPQGLDELFKQMHQGLIVEGGMQRLKVNKIRIMENVAKPESQAAAKEIIRQKKWREVVSLLPIGEQD